MSGIWGVTRADFLERFRRFSFIAMMALALFEAFWFVPRDDGSMQVMAIQADRFIQAGNASWIPIASAWGLGFFLPLIGFFYLRNAITFDENSGVSQLISVSPIGNIRYMLGKLLSGTLLLYCFTAVVILGTLFMTLWHFPGQLLLAHEFLSPFVFLLVALPFCSALAVLFESVRFLRGAIGSTIYVAAFITMYVLVSEAESPGLLLRSFDFSGTSVIFHSISRAVLEQSGQPMDSLLFLGSAPDVLTQPTKQLVFNGIRLSAADFLGFAGMLCVTFGLTFSSAPLYSFTAKLSGIRLPRKRRDKRIHTASEQKSTVAYVPVSPSGGLMWVRGITAEMHLMLSGQPFLWMLVSLGAIIACLFVDLSVVQSYILPLLLLWFINVFSSMGSREYQHDVLKCISVIPNGRLKQIVFSWVSGMLIALVVVSPVILRMMFAGQIGGVLSCIAGVVFLPSLAIFMGEFSKTRRVLELSFVVITYLILNNVTAVMYIGIHPDVVSLARSGIYLAIGISLGVAAILKRISRV